MIISRFRSSLFLTTNHLFFHMLDTLLSNNLAPCWSTLSTMWSSNTLRLLRWLLKVLRSLIQNSIGWSSNSVTHRIIHLITNRWNVLILNGLVTSINTLPRFRFVASTSHLTSRLTLSRCGRNPINLVTILINILCWT